MKYMMFARVFMLVYPAGERGLVIGCSARQTGLRNIVLVMDGTESVLEDNEG